MGIFLSFSNIEGFRKLINFSNTITTFVLTIVQNTMRLFILIANLAQLMHVWKFIIWLLVKIQETIPLIFNNYSKNAYWIVIK